MLDIRFVIENKEVVKKAILDKKISQITPEDVDRLIKLYEEIKDLKSKIQTLRTQRNKIAFGLSKLDRNDPLFSEKVKEGKKLKKDIGELETRLRELEKEFNRIYFYLPGIPSDDTPVGKDENDNVPVRYWGKKPDFGFDPKPHYELLEKYGLFDAKTGVKVAGFRGYYLLGDLALLHLAVLRFAFESIVKKGFIPVIPPTIARYFALFGTGHFPWGEEDAYRLANPHIEEDLYLVGTAEVPLMAYFADRVIPREKLPIKMVGISMCYRREVGAHHKDLKGLYRLHEFWKVEQVVISPPEEEIANKLHEEITHNAEEILQALELPYRVVKMCTADMGELQYRKYDIETWMPGSNKYRETHSSSLMKDTQCRRNNIKVRYKDGRTEYAWSLNNTAIASPRILIAIVENYQEKDGKIRIPDVLQPYMFGKKYLTPLEIF